MLKQMQVFIKVMILHIFTPPETSLQIYLLPKIQFFTVYKLPCTLLALLAFNYCPKCIGSTVYSGVTVLYLLPKLQFLHCISTIYICSVPIQTWQPQIDSFIPAWQNGALHDFPIKIKIGFQDIDLVQVLYTDGV